MAIDDASAGGDPAIPAEMLAELETRANAAAKRWERDKAIAKKLKKKDFPFDAPFELTRDYLAELYEAQGRCCEITKLPFVLEKHPYFKQRPFAPSPDRIDPARGYVRGNVRLVLWFINRAFSQFGGDIFMLVAREAVKNSIAKVEFDPEKSVRDQMAAVLNRPRSQRPWHDKPLNEKQEHNEIVNGMIDVIRAPDLTIYAQADEANPQSLRISGTTFTRRSGEFVDTRVKDRDGGEASRD